LSGYTRVLNINFLKRSCIRSAGEKIDRPMTLHQSCSILAMTLTFLFFVDMCVCSEYIVQQLSLHDRRPIPQLRRCTSRSSQMSREGDIEKATRTCIDAPAYYPVHSQIPTSSQQDCTKVGDFHDSQYAADADVYSSHSRKLPFRQDSRIYTQLQTQLFPDIDF
jgi:hypothetical protein